MEELHRGKNGKFPSTEGSCAFMLQTKPWKNKTIKHIFTENVFLKTAIKGKEESKILDKYSLPKNTLTMYRNKNAL